MALSQILIITFTYIISLLVQDKAKSKILISTASHICDNAFYASRREVGFWSQN